MIFFFGCLLSKSKQLNKKTKQTFKNYPRVKINTLFCKHFEINKWKQNFKVLKYGECVSIASLKEKNVINF